MSSGSGTVFITPVLPSGGLSQYYQWWNGHVITNPYTAGGLFDQNKMMQKKPEKMTETLTHGYSSESYIAVRVLYQHDKV